MALPQSSLSVICASVQEFLRQGLNAAENNIRVLIGAPAEAAKAQGEKKHRVNLFFYRFEPSGFDAGVRPDEPWRLRLYCLITVFGELDDQVPAGENELRILGEIMRLFHQTPVTETVAVGGEQIRLQVVFQPVSGDDLNHIWSTQADTSYRPSVAYEMALVVIFPEEPRRHPPLVGAVGSEVRADITARRAPFGGTVTAPQVKPHKVDIETEGWAPVICFVHDGECLNSVALAIGSDALGEFSPPSVWVAGDPSVTVTLQWEIWERAQGWQEHPDTLDTNPASIGIDPDGDIPGSLPTIALPFADRVGQAVLYAVHRYTRESDDAQIVVRSNPLLVSLF